MCGGCGLPTYSISLRKITGFSDEDKILMNKTLHDSAWNSLWDFFNDTLSTTCELTMLILSLSVSVTFSVICLTIAPFITRSCQQRWPIHS